MKKIVILLFACLFLFCGCSEVEVVEAETEKETKIETEKLCTITFDSQGGSAVESQVIAWGEKAAEPIPPTKDCKCEFDGWYLGDENWSFIGYTVTEDMTLTARWTECHGMSEKEMETLKNFISSRYDDKKTWQDIDSIQKERSARYERCYEYIVTFKDGTVFDNISIQCEYVDN